MCLAIPGKVLSIEKGKIIIDYETTQREASHSVVDVKKGDWVIVNNKIIVNRLSEEEVKKFFELIK
jgi:hydrogenase assembly chaperone HypC/HupF